MSKLYAILLLCISPLAAYGFDGYVHGDNHCFYFNTPKGWVADHVSGKESGVPFVFYPKNSTWSNATTVIYARVMNKSESIKNAEDVVKDTLSLFHTKYQSPNSKAEKIETINTKLENESVIYKFTGDKFGNTEIVSYFNGENTINYFVMTSRDKDDLNKNKKALIELSNSYKESDDCVPCSEKTHNKALNLTHGASVPCAG
ncbi:MAG: hypothetical protein OEX11_00810 [Nitrosomonas sp.]|nr:hypothetical protein [Nitrosomonas sp.]